MARALGVSPSTVAGWESGRDRAARSARSTRTSWTARGPG
ncbi:hypothetical protein [Streptomyces glaucescens]